MIGDSIMAMPLVYEINNCGDTPFVITTDYNFDVISNLVIPIQVNTLTNSERYSFDIIIDFLSNGESANFILNHQNAIKIGFPDGEMNYDINLKLPFNFVDDTATEIFLQALYLINTKDTSKQKYQPKYKWKFNHQQIILIAPGAGNLKRCYELDDFISLADLLIQTGYNVMFILGPLERTLEDLIKKYRYIVTNNMNQTLDILQKSKIVISSEGGFMHICGFLGLPLVGLFRIAKIKNWFPYQLPYQLAIGHETNEYQNITEKNLDLNLVIKKINEINRILDGLS